MKLSLFEGNDEVFIFPVDDKDIPIGVEEYFEKSGKKYSDYVISIAECPLQLYVETSLECDYTYCVSERFETWVEKKIETERNIRHNI